MNDLPRGSGPLAGDIVTGGPIDDPATADQANPRWADPTSPSPDAEPLSAPGDADIPQPPLPDGPPGVGGAPGDAQGGTPQDQAAQPLLGQLEVGRDNIREGRGDTQSNPALAEGGDNG
jgi:hypothetical protein